MIKSRKSLKYDKITSIEFVGMQQTYDFTIPQTHCFFGNDFLVHNSAIKQDAHNIFMVWRNRKKEENGEHEVVVDFQKVRDDCGTGGKVKYIFNPDNQQYYEKLVTSKDVSMENVPEMVITESESSEKDLQIKDLFKKEEK